MIRQRPLVQELEPRRLLAALAVLVNGTLRVGGDGHDDRINVGAQRDGLIRVAIGDTVRRFTAGAVNAIVVRWQSGDDRIEIAANLRYDAAIYGDDGDDADLIDGGIGDDTLIGGAGDDDVFGFDGDDRVYGVDRDEDNLYGGNGDDVMFGDYVDSGSGYDKLYDEYELSIGRG